MSIEVMSHVWKHSQLKGSQLLLLLAIADHARHDGMAWPSIDHLAEKTRMSRRQTISNIQSLVASGELQVVEQGGRGARDTTRYQVITEGAKIAPSTQETRVQSSPIKGAVSADKGAVFDNKGAIATAPESINHQIEPSVNRHSARETRRTKMTAYPDDFSVTESMYEWALEKKGLTSAAVDIETEQFTNHHLAKGTKFVDWERAWRTWMGNVSKWAKEHSGGRAGSGTASRAEDPDRRNWDASKWFED